MSTGKIEVWITGAENPCAVSQQEWEVCVFDCCSRQLVVWCDQRKCAVTKCGTVDFEVPPGCYFLRAKGAGDLAFGVATVGCGQVVCVTLVSFRGHFLQLATEEEKRWLIEEAEKMKPGPSQQAPTP